MKSTLEQFQGGLYYVLFDTPDRIQHMFWRYREPDHPAHRGTALDRKFAGVIDECYVRCDAVVAKVLEAVDDQTLLIVLSDHGFNSFRRGVHLNTWLHDHGFLTLRERIRPGEEAGDLLRHVDWQKTKAYALGLSGIYLNLKDREGQGIVAADDAESIKVAIAQGLAELRDETRGGEVAIRSVKRREEVYQGPYFAEALTCWLTMPVAIASHGRHRWAELRRGISRTTSRSGAATTSLIPAWFPESCS